MAADHPGPAFFSALYQQFSSPLADLDCGEKCGPYNDYGVPVCCDIRQVVPSAFQEEWDFLRERTDLWQPWSGGKIAENWDLEQELQDGQVLLECQGYQRCQRQYRSITCRAFPFFPYLTSQGELLGLAYFRDFQESCWIISNLGVVSQEYKQQFQAAYSRVFEVYPQAQQAYLDFSAAMREESDREHEPLVVLDFSGRVCLVDPATEELSFSRYSDLEAFGPFLITRDLTFPDELDDFDALGYGSDR